MTTKVHEIGAVRLSQWTTAPYEAAACSSEVNRTPDFYRVESLTAFGTGICEVAALTVEPVVLVVASRSPTTPAAVIVAEGTEPVVVEAALAGA